MEKIKKLKATFNAVIVEPQESGEGLYGNIIVPDMGKEKNEIGVIISIGEGHYSVMGNFIPTTLKVGDIVILPTMGFTKLPFQGKDYYVGPENQILGLIS